MKSRTTVMLLLLLLLVLSGCASQRQARDAERHFAEGRQAEGVSLLASLADRYPDKYRLRYLKARDKATHQLMQQARFAGMQGRSDEAFLRYNEVLRIDQAHAEARYGLEQLAARQQAGDLLAQARAAEAANDLIGAQRLLADLVAVQPQHVEARQLRQRIEMIQHRGQMAAPVLRGALQKSVSLEFRNASLQSVFEVLSRSSGLSFIFDRDVKSDLRTTIYARDTTVEDALRLILQTSQLSHKVLNDSTVLIYPGSGDKEKQYEELVMRSFYLGSADPKKAQDMIRTLIAPRAMYVDESLRLLMVRDSPSVMDAVERLVSAYDIATPEVVLEVEILEVSDDALLNVGLQYPDRAALSVSGAAAKPGQLTVDELESLGRDNFTVLLPDPLAVLNLKQTSGKARTLANPRIRVRNREKAKVLIGDKVPVITTTTNQTSGSTSESVSYLDVGLKLDVEPEVHVDSEVTIAIGLEVSSIVKEVKSTTGLLTYQIGTRTANTSLRLRDGETQMLAGLIKDEERDSASHVPGLGKLPLIGWIFSNETSNKSRSEIVLLITPRVVRGLTVPPAHVTAFASGTGSRVGTSSLRLGRSSQYSNTDKAVFEKQVGGQGLLSNESKMVVESNKSAPRLDMIMPGQVPVGEEFTIAIMAASSGPSELELLLDLPGLEYVSAAAVASLDTFESAPIGNGVRLRATSQQALSGPLGLVTVRAVQAHSMPLTLSLSRMKMSDERNAPVQGAQTVVRNLRVVP